MYKTPDTTVTLPSESDPLRRKDGSSVWPFLAPVFLIVIILLDFVPALDAGFVGWDDDDLIFNTTGYRTLDAESLRWMFTTSDTGHFQPLVWLSFTLDWALWHREAFGYHLTNVLLHILNALGFYFLTRRLITIDCGRERAIQSTSVVLSSLFAAVIFAVHPLRAESVAWIAERRDVLAGFFFIASVYCYVRYATNSGDMPMLKTRRRVFFGGSVALCAVSLLAKASAISLPIVLLILDFYPLRRRAVRLVRRRRLLLEKLPFLVLATLAGMQALVAQARSGVLRDLVSHDAVERIAQACYGLVFYLGKTLWPVNLGPLYEIPPREILLGPMFSISLLVMGVLAVLVFAMRRRVPAFLTALLIYAVVLLPVLGLVQRGSHLVADRYSYLSCMSLAVLAAGGVRRLLDAVPAITRPRTRALAMLGLISIVAVLAKATSVQADIWKSGQTLWRRGVKVSPNSSIAHTNFADALQAGGWLLPALHHYRQALALDPYDAVAFHHMGDLIGKSGNPSTAMYCYHRALQIDPNRHRACFSLARLLVARGHVRDAVTILRDGAQRNPGALAMIDFLVQLLATHSNEPVRNPEEAVFWAMHINRARSFGHPPSLMTLGTAYAATGKFDDAVLVIEHALELAEAQSSRALITELRHRLEMFKEGKPYGSASTP